MANKKVTFKSGADNIYPETVGFVAGNTASVSGTLQCPGSWASATSLRFTIPLTEEVLHASRVELSGGGYIRCDGTNAGISSWSDAGTVTCGLTRHGVDVNVVYSSAPSYAKANYPVIVQPANCMLTFS